MELRGRRGAHPIPVAQRFAGIHIFQVGQVLEEEMTLVSRRACAQHPVLGRDVATAATNHRVWRGPRSNLDTRAACTCSTLLREHSSHVYRQHTWTLEPCVHPAHMWTLEPREQAAHT